MSKYPYLNKKGRPSKDEQKVCLKINRLLNEGSITEDDIQDWTKSSGTPKNLDELENMFSYLTGEEVQRPKKKYFTGNEKHKDIIDSEVIPDINDVSDIEVDDFDSQFTNDFKSNNSSNMSSQSATFDPFQEPVVERSYTQGFVPNNDSNDDNESILDEDDFQKPEGGEDVSGNLSGNQNFEDIEDEEIPEPSWRNTFTEEEEEEEEYDYEKLGEKEEEESGGKLGEGNLEDLSPAQKRKAAEKTADAILQMYASFAPMPFKKWASFSEFKIQKLAFQGDIDLNMQVENGVTVQDYIDGTNQQVDEIFTVPEETKQEIKDPLIDVLLEQEIALTPTQRLMLAVGSHVVTMGFQAYQLSQNNKMALEQFKKFHENNQKINNPSVKKSKSKKQKKSNSPIFDDELSETDKGAVEELLNEINKNDGDIIDADNDPTVEVSETDYDD